MKGYLVIYIESEDEIHADLVSKTTYDRATTLSAEGMHDEAIELVDTRAVKHWFLQTCCTGQWPYNNDTILGILHIVVT